jgi:pyruvate dehydrogenase E1 component alpha subunit
MYYKMLLIRKFEEKVFLLYRNKTLSGTTHLCIGQEAIPVGLAAAIQEDDYLTCTYRGHGVLIARGSDPKTLMAELFGKESGICQGKGGSMHLTDFSHNVLGSFAIVGAHLPIAAGVGLSIRLRKTDQISVAIFGDGAVNIGAFHEALNVATIWKLPLLFVCENNLYGEHTPYQLTSPVKNVADRALAYGIKSAIVDGNDVISVYEQVRRAAADIRNGSGPFLIECKTYRLRGHSRDDPGDYRPKEEISYWTSRDPIAIFKKRLEEQGFLNHTQDIELNEQAYQAVEESTRFAIDSPFPEPNSIYADVLAWSDQ